MYRVGIVGASGYTGAELLRLCFEHPQFELVWAMGETQAGSDVADQKRIGLEPNEAGMKSLREKLGATGGIPADAPPEVAVEKTYAALAAAPSRVLLATLDDAVAVPERPNVPGTVREWPNWSLALPQPLEEIEALELPRRLAAVLRRG